MKPVLEYLPREEEESFVVKYFDYDYYPTPWHYHPEYELVLVTESTGKRFIGDNIKSFSPGDLALIGPNVPHLYRNDPPYYQPQSGLRASSIVIHFLASSIGDDFLALPACRKIRELLSKSAMGLDIKGKANTMVAEQMHQLLELKGVPRLLKLLDILNTLAETKDKRHISNQLVKGENDRESERLNKVFEYVMKNFLSEISITDVAGLVHMAENSFSRYFSQRTRKTFSAFVNEIRLSHSSRLLADTDKSVSEICFASGFNNLSNFNRQFKSLYGLSPLAYRNQYIVKA
ncbi:AraC family transcriptional regulator [Mucilaginibacter sp.]|uniref:AraC family transcriptional regulator n=1 Tax=Mucilaginibacter sp. TaxID=1882438 RepID=UPI00326577D1